MISRMVENAVFWINALPVNSGMSYKISPWTLITGTTIYFKRHWKIEFVVYAEAHKKTFPCNSTRSCTEPAICIGSTVNLQGYYWFLNLRTGWHIKQCTFNPLSIPTQCIYSVHVIADADNHNPALDFFERLGNPIPYCDTPGNDNKDDTGYLAGVEENNNQMEIPGVAAPNQEDIPWVTSPEQEEIPGVATPEEEEEIPEVDIPEEEDE